MTDVSIRWLADRSSALTIADATWFTQPVATVIAAGIAVVAALIAFSGVLLTLRRARRESRRKEKAEALVDGFVALQTMAREIARIAGTADHGQRLSMVEGTAGQKVFAATDAWTVANARLLMYGMENVMKPAEPFLQKVQQEWDGLVAAPVFKADAAEILRLYNDSVPAFAKAMKSLK